MWKQERDRVIEYVGDLVREFGTSSDDRKVALIPTQAYRLQQSSRLVRLCLWTGPVP